ncbi:CmcI family methyltransferase [Dyella solisilvae]|uniref:CmcI family methyltransferase n=1 Tax=Dyella solisilvae TaxID=1920168 RepID=UPI001314E8EF|nr:CmcI family methyltransferase [Dyella solisilvae]
MEGVVDGLVDGNLRGWAWFPGSPDAVARVAIQDGNEVLAEVEASEFRSDLAAAGKRGGHCAFLIPLPPMPDGGASLTVVVGTRGGKHELPGSPVTVVPRQGSIQTNDMPDVLPVPLGTDRLRGSLDACGPSRIRGWAHWLDATTHPVTLRLLEGEREWMRFEASQWRVDLAGLRDGDGSCGFDLPLPEALGDGQLHMLELRVLDDDSSPLPGPIRVRVATANMPASAKARRNPNPLKRGAGGGAITLSVIVNFYNMPREAARTLTSLSRRYQTDIDDLDYEVLCIDNGSQPPLDPEWISSFGPEFRLIRPSRLHPSPCGAINEAALQARGRYLAVMIDGAHLLTPGVFREARQAWREHVGAVVAVRHWFIGGDQRWLAMSGYSREQEDRLFDRIRWPSNGYELFRIGAPIGENPEPWFDNLAESNCLMLPTALYDNLGGIDEAFDEGGGGFANLDLCRRASEMAEGPLVSLIGEASFHQYHGGTTTNVDDDAKDVRVRSYARAYRTLRGEEFNCIHRSQLQFRGHVPSECAIGVRQRVLLPMRLEVTEKVRRAQLAVHFDDGAQAYLQSVYGEAGLHHEVSWLGQPVGVAPADMSSLQEIIHEVRPDAVIAVGAKSGLVRFVANVLQAAGAEGTRVLCIQSSHPSTPSVGVTSLQGAPNDPGVLATVRNWTGLAESVLVLFAAEPAGHFTREALQAYGALVSHRSYLVCLGTLFGQPWLGYSRRQHLRTVQDFVDGERAFVIDSSRERQWLSTCPSGYLRKVGAAITASSCDPALDDINLGAFASWEISA